MGQTSEPLSTAAGLHLESGTFGDRNRNFREEKLLLMLVQPGFNGHIRKILIFRSQESGIELKPVAVTVIAGG